MTDKAFSNSDGSGKNPFTPLGIIAIFIALSETIAGMAAVKTEGGVQIIFAIFSVLFPLLIASVFFLILWRRAYVLYPPRDFGPDVNVGSYVEAMRHQSIGNQDLQVLLRTTIAETFASQEARVAISQVAPGEGKPSESELQQASEVIAEQVFDRLQSSLIVVDIRAYRNQENSELAFPYDANDRAFSLFSAIYFQIEDFVDPFSYGKQWVLQDAQSKNFLLPIGIDWSENNALSKSNITVAQLGIESGARLQALPMAHAIAKARKYR
jgi:hypothetical protein